MKRVLRYGVLVTMMLAACSVLGKKRETVAEQSGVAFKGEPSVDVLVDRFVTAVSAKDEKTLHSLRVNEAEYRRIIIPGSVAVGKTPHLVEDRSNLFFWQTLDERSRDFAQVVLSDFGGRQLQHGEITYTKKPREYAWYRAYGEVRIPVKDQEGHAALMKTGWIAEVDGQYKFIGFNWDD